VARIERLVSEHPDMEGSVFTEREMAYCQGKRRRYEHLAARFAAKEAVLKAFGTGMSRRMRWTDVEILNDELGRPEVRLGGAVASYADHRGLEDLDVSLSHTEDLAVAQAVTIWSG
jgi:holo-[acyl-carrier protein] synthase